MMVFAKMPFELLSEVLHTTPDLIEFILVLIESDWVAQSAGGRMEAGFV